ncbi:hypothetical protein C8J56DRAFT_1049365 [Mycena floridula]|nr:hypothetical protein C8J56DRAFT_1049365 [Mycena floridula]
MSTTRVACITGAAQGIGRAIVLRLAIDGCNRQNIKKTGRKAIAIAVDIKEAEVENLVSQTVKVESPWRFGYSIMVANAGVACLGNILETSVEELGRVHGAVNVKGTFMSYKAAAKVMIEQGRGGNIIRTDPLIPPMSRMLIRDTGACSLAGKKGTIRPCFLVKAYLFDCIQALECAASTAQANLPFVPLILPGSW